MLCPAWTPWRPPRSPERPRRFSVVRAAPSEARLEELVRHGIHKVTCKPYDVIEAVAARNPGTEFKCGICADPVIRLMRYKPEWYLTMWVIFKAQNSLLAAENAWCTPEKL